MRSPKNLAADAWWGAQRFVYECVESLACSVRNWAHDHTQAAGKQIGSWDKTTAIKAEEYDAMLEATFQHGCTEKTLQALRRGPCYETESNRIWAELDKQLEEAHEQLTLGL